MVTLINYKGTNNPLKNSRESTFIAATENVLNSTLDFKMLKSARERAGRFCICG